MWSNQITYYYRSVHYSVYLCGKILSNMQMWTHSLRGSGYTGRCSGPHHQPGCRQAPGCCSWWTSRGLWAPLAPWWWWYFAFHPTLRNKRTERCSDQALNSHRTLVTIQTGADMTEKPNTPPSGKTAQNTTRYPFKTPCSVILGGSAHVITASSDVTEMARTFWGGWLGTGDGGKRKGQISYLNHVSSVI